MLDTALFLWYYAGIAEWSNSDLKAVSLAVATFAIGYALIVYTITWKGRK